MNIFSSIQSFLNKSAPVKEKFSNLNSYSSDAMVFSQIQDFSMEDIVCSQISNNISSTNYYSANWYLPGFHNAFYGGVMTILRFASYMVDNEKVHQRFLICGDEDADRLRDSIINAFPSLRESEILILNSAESIDSIPPSDFSFATLWTTAYVLLKVNNTNLKFYFIQDFEPLFYPAGSTYAQVEATYRFGFYGITNTISLREIYESDYGGQGVHFTPCIDPSIFYPIDPKLKQRNPESPKRIFFYGRPNHPRNAFELATSAMRLVKSKYGSNVEILSAGANWDPQDYGLEGIVQNLGLLSYEGTGDLYRSCDIGLSMMMTKHPSYLPFEMMACGVLVISNINSSTKWFLRDRENCLITYASASCIFETIKEAIEKSEEMDNIKQNAILRIQEKHSNWSIEFQNIYNFISALDFKNRNTRGFLVQSNGTMFGNKVFYVNGRDRYYVPNIDWIESHGFSWLDDIRYTTDEFLLQFNDAGLATTLYLLEDYQNPPRNSSLEMRKIVTSQLYGYGIEFGAGTSPFPVPKHCHVKYVDKMSIESLQLELYPGQKTNDLVTPDIYDDLELFGAFEDNSLDFIIACHVIEHTKNPLKVLQKAYAKLHFGGSLVLIIPDKEKTFDRMRQLTSLEHLILDYYYPSQDRDKSHYVDFYTFAFETSESDLDRVVEDKFSHNYPIHFHVWNYQSFGEVITYSIDSFISPWSSVWSQPTLDHPIEDIEFYFVLTK